MRNSVFWFVVAVGLVATQYGSSSRAQDASAEPMRFEAAWGGGNCNLCAWVAAQGTITESTPDDFSEFLRVNGREHSRLAFDSRGGNLLAGIKLGELIREIGWDTSIGKTVVTADTSEDRYDIGECYSACALAFLGGVNRYAGADYLGVIEARSKYGVHQFYDSLALSDPQRNAFSAIDVSVSQLVTGLILDYVSRMGVDPRLIALASAISPWEPVYVLSKDELVELGVTNMVARSSEWKIEAYQDGAVLTASHTLGTLPQKHTTFFCRGSQRIPYLLVSSTVSALLRVNPGTTAASIMNDVSAVTISIDGQTYSTADLSSVDLTVRLGNDDMLYGSIALYPAKVDEIAKAKLLSFDIGLPRYTDYPLTVSDFEVEGIAPALSLVMRNCLQ